MITYLFNTDIKDLFTVTIVTGEIDPMRVLKKIIVVMKIECFKFFDGNQVSEFEKWLYSTAGKDAVLYNMEKYMLSNSQTSSLNLLPVGGYNVCTVGGTFTITMRDHAVCTCVSICVIMRDEILPRLNYMLEN
mgnify:CR=1 FL=1